jgi:hypothetical protein
MRISTAPTPFDAIPKEDRIAWLEQKPTDALLVAVTQRIQEFDQQLTIDISLSAIDADLGQTYRAVRAYRTAYAQLLDWILSAKVDIRRTSDAA